MKLASRLIGVDLGGTKIEVVALDGAGRELLRRRVATPQGDYAATIAAAATMLLALKRLRPKPPRSLDAK